MGTSFCLPSKPDEPPAPVAANKGVEFPDTAFGSSDLPDAGQREVPRGVPKRAESKLKILPPDQEARARNALFASFVADALALGVHWEYSAEVIKEKYGTPDKFIKPGELNQYHAGKEAGDLTHYGDQMLLLLEHVASRKRFNPSAFMTEWSAWFASYEGYKDQASKATYEHLTAGKGPAEAVASDSNDLAGASRIGPLLYIFAAKTELVKLIQAARNQATLTHGGALPGAAAEFFARVAHAVLSSNAVPTTAMRSAAEAIGDPLLQEKVDAGLAAAAPGAFPNDDAAVTSFGPVKEFAPGKKVAVGKSCNADYALSATVYFIAKYEGLAESAKAAIVANNAVGGDQAARGALIGLVLGAREGSSGAVPPAWTSGLRAKPKIDKALTLCTSLLPLSSSMALEAVKEGK